ncbi:MAG: alpha-D-ribose 1-methylphosphonate 5-triphosphate diphosphatase [Hyphomicrobiaceae bacterium]
MATVAEHLSADTERRDVSAVTVFEDARIVLEHRIIEQGWLAVEHGRIVEYGEGKAPECGIGCSGDILMPGLVELHTDHLETHVEPRPQVRWSVDGAVQAYDVQIAGSGITTVFDCLRLGTDGDNPDPDVSPIIAVAEALGRAEASGALRAEHHTHLRCEVASDNVVIAAEAFLARCPAGLISIMDHTPGQRQFRDREKLATYYRGKLKMSEPALEAFFAQRIALYEKNEARHRRALVDIAHAHAIPLASHDDTTLEHVAESVRDGARIAEFPTTLEAAVASHEAGIAVMMGAPNIMLGGSHSGNVAARTLAEADVLDVLSSDYVPASLIQAVFTLPRIVPGFTLEKSVALVTANPARAIGLCDRGRIERGLKADLVRIAMLADVPVVRSVFREGRRVS